MELLRRVANFKEATGTTSEVVAGVAGMEVVVVVQLMDMVLLAAAVHPAQAIYQVRVELMGVQRVLHLDRVFPFMSRALRRDLTLFPMEAEDLDWL
jgi:hypothetical protein